MVFISPIDWQRDWPAVLMFSFCYFNMEDMLASNFHVIFIASSSLICYFILKHIFQKMLDQDESRKSKQRIGFKNSLIFDTKPTSDGRV